MRHKNLVRLLGYCIEGTQRYSFRLCSLINLQTFVDLLHLAFLKADLMDNNQRVAHNCICVFVMYCLIKIGGQNFPGPSSYGVCSFLCLSACKISGYWYTSTSIMAI